MSINEVFPNPTVKEVIFQIRFPSLFIIESKIGEFQLKIMKEFPESALLYRRQLVFVDMGVEAKLEDIQSELDKQSMKKIWQFKSQNKVQLNVLFDSLNITSKHHKTYNNISSKDRFRDTIEFALKNFFEVISIPIINRIGLRYVDECPIKSKTNEWFKKWYNSVFPLHRFNLEEAEEMVFKTVIKKDKNHLIYLESLEKTEDNYYLKLDFDGFAMNIDPKDCLKVTDDLHNLISDEYEKTIKEPVKEYMRKERSVK